MPSLTIDKFDGGLDLRKGAAVADANRLRELLNAYVTTGHHIKKRPGLTRVAELEPGTVGLVPGIGRLNTFFSDAAVAHSNPLFRANRLEHPTDPARALAQIYRGEVFNGALYVSSRYDDGSKFHHYLDADDAWVAATNYALGDFVEPTTPNGFRYEATADAGSSDSAEPTWPTVVGATVVDAGITWTCRSKAIADANCPHHPSFVRAASKIFSPNPDAENVRFSATNAPRDWTTASDAGFLPTGVQATGDAVPTGVGRYRSKLAVSHSDQIQTWVVDEDPNNHALDQIVDVGSLYPRTFGNVSQDLYFLSPFGFRSISTLELTGNLQDLDVGSPIDELAVADLASTTDPQALFFHGGGQYWCHLYGGVVWVFTYSRVSKVYAWSRYEFPVTIDAMAELGNVLYLRSGDVVYRVDASAYTDDGTLYTVRARLPFLDAKKPGQLKQWLGVDYVMAGEADCSFLYDPDDEALETDPVAVSGNTAANGMIPVECMSTEIALVFSNRDDADWQLQRIVLYHDNLGPM